MQKVGRPGTIEFAKTKSRPREAEMKCSTEMEKRDEQEAMKGWEKVVAGIGIDLEQSAREAKAIQRRRGIRNGKDLLRLVMMYALRDWSLRMVGLWAVLVNIGYMSDVAVMKRIQKSRKWIGRLISAILQRRCSACQSIPGVRLRIMDATTVSGPASRGADWRAHLCFDLGDMCLDGIELTDGSGGESLLRFEAQVNEVRIVDGGYPSARGMGPMLLKGSGLIVRINWRNVSVRTSDNKRFDIISWLRNISAPTETHVWLDTPQGWFQLRLLANPLPLTRAEEARRKLRSRNEKKGIKTSDETLFAAGFVLLLTNLPAAVWPVQLIFSLYRLRWQIEIQIKRLKSLLHFDCLRTKNPDLAQTYLLAKLLAALIIDQCHQVISICQPDWFSSLDRPANYSRLTQFHLEFLHQSITGAWKPSVVKNLLIILRRYLCDSPRARPQHLAWGRALAYHLSISSAFFSAFAP